MDKKHLRLIQLYKNLEEKKSQSRSNGYYSVFLSILNTNNNNNASKGNSEPEYSYRQVYIRVNNQQQATTGNKDQFIMYSIQTGEQEMVYAGFLPKNKELKNAITLSLFHRFNTAGFQAGVDTLAIQSQKTNTSKNPTIAGNCLNDPPDNCMMVFVPFVGYYPTCNIVCEQTQGGGGGSNNGGDTGSSSGSDSGSGSSGSEGGDSKGGGGGSNGGNQGGGCSVRDGNTCGSDAPTNDENDDEKKDPDKPCEGNPVKNPRIAKQTNSGVDGGRFGPNRKNSDGTAKDHKGIDIKNNTGDSIFSMYDGKVVSVGNDPEGIGYYVTVQAKVDGTYHTIQYGHLKKSDRPTNGSTISASDLVGKQGTSGNLQIAVDRGLAKPHTHIIVRERTGSGWNLENDYSDPINPEDIMETKFDDQGDPVAGTDC